MTDHVKGGAGPMTFSGALARALVAAAAMTAWDVVMDPGMAKAGSWVWENGGSYFGVPVQNYVGWMATTLTVYVLAALAFRFVPTGRGAGEGRFHGGLPIIPYALVAADNVLINRVPELHVVAAFGIGLVALIALLRLLLGRGTIALP